MGEFSDAFSEGLEKFFLSVKSAANTVAQKTKEGASFTKTSIHIQEEENKLKKLYTKLGIRTLLNEGVDEAWEKELKSEYIPSREEILREIKEHRAKILEYQQELQKAKNPQYETPNRPSNWEAEPEKADNDEYIVESKEQNTSYGETIKPPMSDGVRVFNFCPSCHCGNIPNVKKCIYCGYIFNEK